MDKNIAENSSSESESTRWKPTLQQKDILKDIYKSGMQSPPDKEIERITSLLKNYGRVERRNVKCWFQNFKARERKAGANVRGTTLSIPKLATTASTSHTGIGDQADLANIQGPRRVISNVDPAKSSLSTDTLELFPLKPDGGGLGLGRARKTRF